MGLLLAGLLVFGMGLFTSVKSSTPGVATISSVGAADLISASHFSQTCSFKCNSKLMDSFSMSNSSGSHLSVYVSEWQGCCNLCPGNKCYDFCSFTCNLGLSEKLRTCKKGDAGCKRGGHTSHAHYCEHCPAKKCTGQTTPEDYAQVHGI